MCLRQESANKNICVECCFGIQLCSAIFIAQEIKEIFPELVGKDSGIGLKVKENWKNIQVPLKSEIKDGMRKIIDHNKEMSEAGRERAIKYFDIKNWIKKHDEIFQTFIKT